jgi:hypothetical protein
VPPAPAATSARPASPCPWAATAPRPAEVVRLRLLLCWDHPYTAEAKAIPYLETPPTGVWQVLSHRQVQGQLSPSARRCKRKGRRGETRCCRQPGSAGEHPSRGQLPTAHVHANAQMPGHASMRKHHLVSIDGEMSDRGSSHAATNSSHRRLLVCGTP